MIIKNFTKLFILAILATTLTSCNNSRDYKDNSRATGWDLNSRDGGLNYNTDYDDQEPGPGLLFVEGGTFTMGRVQDDVMHDWNNIPTQQHVQSFFIDETEVTNVMYLEYLDWLKQVFPPNEDKYVNIYKGALPDTLVWRNPLGFNETMVNNYLRHPAYHNYPVVGVNWIQATEFSQWRTDRVNEKRLSDKGYTSKDAYKNSSAESVFNTETYINAPNQVYGGDQDLTTGGRESQRKARNNDPDAEPKNIYVQRKDGELLPAYRLPTEAEWEYAALGQSSLRDYNSFRGRKKYPWDGQYTRSGNRKDIGDQKANFKQGRGDYGGIAGWSDDGADITNEVKSYEPNDYGLYDMAGNVSEWVADVYRPKVDNEFNDFNYFRGNLYTKNVISEDGKLKVLTADEVVYDTLSNGKIIARSVPGEIAQVAISEEETYLRTQFSRSDNVNFRDGDKASSRYYNQNNLDDEERAMYNSPDNNITINDGKIDRNYDSSSSRTTLIDDYVRVYKGGSWTDREYWLDPAQRRYYPQHMSTNDIGFRNAMSKVGSKSTKGRRTRN